MRTRRQAKRNLIVIFQRITTKDIKGNKKGTSTNPKPKILFLFLSFFFFPSSPVPHFSAALVIPSLNWNLAFLFPHFLTNKTNLPLHSTTHHRMHSDPITHENISALKPGLTRCLESLIEAPPRPSHPHSLLEHIQKIYIPGPAPRTRFGPNSPLRPSRTDPDPYRVDPRTRTMKQAIARDKR